MYGASDSRNVVNHLGEKRTDALNTMSIVDTSPKRLPEARDGKRHGRLVHHPCWPLRQGSPQPQKICICGRTAGKAILTRRLGRFPFGLILLI